MAQSGRRQFCCWVVAVVVFVVVFPLAIGPAGYLTRVGAMHPDVYAAVVWVTLQYVYAFPAIEEPLCAWMDWWTPPLAPK